MASLEKDAAAIDTAKGLANVLRGDEYEKMISGMAYSTRSPELREVQLKARKFMKDYNTHFRDGDTRDSLAKAREEMLKGIMGRVGTGVYIEPPISVDYGCNIQIGDNFYSNFHLVILDSGLVTIGNRVQFGPFVSIYSATHETDVQSRRDKIQFTKPVIIGDDCWIGGNTTIIAGVTIGSMYSRFLCYPCFQGCTIGAGSVVTRDIPEFSVAVGSPARVVKNVAPVSDL
ncbi:putative sugar O-acetyltransferase [Nemania abortiva]|nr:putative sugar O-acetyltransferase [Nemania abortiva]